MKLVPPTDNRPGCYPISVVQGRVPELWGLLRECGSSGQLMDGPVR